MGQQGNPIDKPTIKKIISDFEAGNTIGYTAKVNNVHRCTVKKYLKKFSEFKKSQLKNIIKMYFLNQFLEEIG